MPDQEIAYLNTVLRYCNRRRALIVVLGGTVHPQAQLPEMNETYPLISHRPRVQFINH